MPVETGVGVGVAGETVALRLNEIDERVAIAVDEHVDHLHEVATCLTLDPARFARGGVEAGEPRFECLAPSGFVRVGDHQHFQSGGILDYHHDQPISLFEIRPENLHRFHRTPSARISSQVTKPRRTMPQCFVFVKYEKAAARSYPGRVYVGFLHT